MISRRAARASSNFVFPSIALRVQAETSAPFPSDAASTSIPSSVMTVESTSKQTASARAKASIAPAIFCPSNWFLDCAEKDAKISDPDDDDDDDDRTDDRLV